MNRSSLLSDLLSAVEKRRRALFDRDGDVGRQTPAEIFEIFDRLLSSVGEASGIALARLALDGYQKLDWAGKTTVLASIRDDYCADTDQLDRAVAAYLESHSMKSVSAVHAAAETRRQELFRRLNQAPGGTADLVHMRADLLKLLRADPSYSEVDDDFLHLFSAWFNRGFLMMRRVDWNTSASILERIIRYEAVHEISDWDELRRRVDADDRRLYAFFHPSLLDEPLIFVEVALTDGIPDAIGPILAAERTQLSSARANSAVFYAISNCQDGLRGVSFGSFLIKQVAQELQAEFPRIKNFATLSPVPRLRRWVTGDDPMASGLSQGSAELLEKLANGSDKDIESRDQAEINRVVAAYLLVSDRGDGQSVDPVCRFHLGNGAQLERINLFANKSEAGLAESYGVMVNYLYDLDKVEANHEDYANRSVRSAASSISRLVKGIEPSDFGAANPEAAA